MTIDEMIAVLQAAKEGKLIQCREKTDDDSDSWTDGAVGPFVWNFYNYDYRVKPKPMELTLWVSTNGRILQEEDEPVLSSRWEKKKFREVIE